MLEVRRLLWQRLVETAESVTMPWLVIGDFNDVTNSSEKSGGSLPSLGRCNLFNSMISSCNLIDLEFNGPAFTWLNKRKGLARVQERLDRVLANAEWRLCFPDAVVQHLPRMHSDHCPILLFSEVKSSVDHSKRPFRFHSHFFFPLLRRESDECTIFTHQRQLLLLLQLAFPRLLRELAIELRRFVPQKRKSLRYL